VRYERDIPSFDSSNREVVSQDAPYEGSKAFDGPPGIELDTENNGAEWASQDVGQHNDLSALDIHLHEIDSIVAHGLDQIIEGCRSHVDVLLRLLEIQR